MKQDVNEIEFSNNLWEFLQYYIKNKNKNLKNQIK